MGCAVVRTDKVEVPHILFTTRAPLPFQTDLHLDRLAKEVLRVLVEVGERAESFLQSSPYGRKVDRVAFVLSSTWYSSGTHFLSFNYKKPFTVTPRFVDKMLMQAEEGVVRDSRQPQKDKYIQGPALIEKKLLHVALNGYSTSQPFDKQANRIDLSLYVAFAASSLSQELADFADARFRGSHLSIHSHGLAIYTAVRDYYTAEGNYLLLDINGELSEVSLVLNNVLLESISFPIGTHTIARTIAAKRGGTYQEALSLMALAGKKDGALDQDSEEYKLVLEKGEKWRSEFLNALLRFDSTVIYPNQIFLTAPREMGPWFSELIERTKEDIIEQGVDFSVTSLSPHLVRGLVALEAGVTPDPPLALQSLHVSHI